MVRSTESYERWVEAAGTALAGGDRMTAERALRSAIQAVDGLQGSHLELTAALVRLGALKQEMGNHGEAEELFRKALDVGERSLGPDDLALVPPLKYLGAARILRGVPQEAEPLLARALAISERQLGAEHPDIVILLNDLTRLYLKQSAHAYAEPLLQRLLTLKQSKGEDHPEVATVLASLAAVRQALGRHEAAEQLWRRVLSIRERTLAPNHFAIATAIEHLGETCAARGKVQEALQLFQRAQTIRELTLGAEHASLRSSRERIADLQLQASENLLEPDDSLAVTPSPPRISASALARTEEPARAPIPFIPLEPISAAADPVEFELTTQPSQPDPVPYLNVLLDIKQELDDTDDEEAGTSVAVQRTGFATSAIALLRQRPKALAAVGVGVVALPLLGVAVAGAAGAGPLAAMMGRAAFAEGLPRRDSMVTAPITAPEIRQMSAGDLLRDSLAAASAAQKTVSSRPSEDRAAPRKAAEPEEIAISLPTMPRPTVGKLDSVVRAMSVPVRPVEESFQVQLSSLADNTPRSTATAAPSRARAVGVLPTPVYPDHLLKGGVGGEVRVRFDVDTIGRPVMSTFSVIGSPHAALSAAVKKVIPDMRFDPARTPWPESRPIVDKVELGFQFTPRGPQNNDDRK
jgi:tetratricopeptide (TPR) repeat protein